MSEPTRVRAGKPRAGFVLVGGGSTRMGRDKALLPRAPEKFGDQAGGTLLEHVASRVQRAAGNVTLVGRPERYSALGYSVIRDVVEGCGPLGGLYTALSVTEADWNLIVACDMPGVTAEFLEQLLHAAESSTADCLVPGAASGLDPLCAVYHRRCLPAAAFALDHKILKMHDFLSSLQVSLWPLSNPALVRNVNTPEQWRSK